jgi:hypothetical protein
VEDGDGTSHELVKFGTLSVCQGENCQLKSKWLKFSYDGEPMEHEAIPVMAFPDEESNEIVIDIPAPEPPP